MIGRLGHNSPLCTCRLALENLLGRFHVLRQAASSLESMAVMAFGDNVIKQCVRTILELAP